MTTPKKTSKTSKATNVNTKKKEAPQRKEVLKPRKGVEKICEDRLEDITGGKPINPVSWAVDRS